VKLSWDDAAERSVDPVTSEVDFEGYRIYRATDPDFRDARIITNGTGSNTIGNGRPVAQFDLVDGRKGFTRKTVEGVAYQLGNDSGIQHTYEDTDVQNGQEYWYAVCAYDFGFDPGAELDSLAFYPSENSYNVSRTLRGGTILPTNVVRVRPNPRVPGFVRAQLSEPVHSIGRGVGTVEPRVVNSTQIPAGHQFALRFTNRDPDSVRANRYTLEDVTAGQVLFTTGNDFVASGRGPVGAGILPVVSSIPLVRVDTTFFESAVTTNARLSAIYQPGWPIELRRPGFPNDLVVRFAATAQDTSIGFNFRPAKPAKFRIYAVTDSGETQLDFGFTDTDNDGTLSLANETVDVLTRPVGQPVTTADYTWRIRLDTSQPPPGGTLVPPGAGDVWRLKTRRAVRAGRGVHVHEPGRDRVAQCGGRHGAVRRAESLPRRGELRAGTVQHQGPRRTPDRVPRHRAGRHGVDLHRARRSRADPAAGRLVRRIPRLEPADEGQSRRGTGALRVQGRRAGADVHGQVRGGEMNAHENTRVVPARAGDVADSLARGARGRSSSRLMNHARELDRPRAPLDLLAGARAPRCMHAVSLNALLLLLSCTLLAGVAQAQSKVGTSFGAFTLIEPDARLAGMGNAGVSAGEGLPGAFHNGAAVAELDKHAFEFAHVNCSRASATTGSPTRIRSARARFTDRSHRSTRAT
jgi:hypothetical protein